MEPMSTLNMALLCIMQTVAHGSYDPGFLLWLVRAVMSACVDRSECICGGCQ